VVLVSVDHLQSLKRAHSTYKMQPNVQLTVNNTWLIQLVALPLTQPDFDQTIAQLKEIGVHVVMWDLDSPAILVTTWRPESWWVN
jgi:hypothetical protein